MATFDVNDLSQLPDLEWFEDPPEWFRYFVARLTGSPLVNTGEVEDALEKISPSGAVPGWALTEEDR